MKKVLLATTAFGVLAAGSAFAAEPTVTLGGHVDFQAGIADANSDFESGVYSRETHTRTEADLVVTVEGKADNGLGYGAEIVLNADSSEPENSEGSSSDVDENAEEVSIYIESGYGKVKAGSTYGSNNALKVDAGSFARATGGISGDFYRYVDLDGSGDSGTADLFALTPDLPSTIVDPINNDHVATATSNKVSYYSPRFSGVQVGVSYTPDLDERGTSTGFSGSNDRNDIENLWELGANYQGQYDQVGIEASFTSEFGSIEDRVRDAAQADDGVEAWAVGIALTYTNFTFGGSYGDAEQFGVVSLKDPSYSYFTLGAAYEQGPLGVSVTYLSSETENGSNAVNYNNDAEFTNLVIGADYQLAPGLVPYVELSIFDADDNDSSAAQPDNDGSVLIVGTGLSF